MRENYKDLKKIFLLCAVFIFVLYLNHFFTQPFVDYRDTYRNERLGFSISLPRFMSVSDEKGESVLTPVAAYDDVRSNFVFIAPIRYYETGYDKFYSGQGPSTKSLDTTYSSLLNNYPIFVWKIEIRDISSDALNSFIKEKIGPDCKFVSLGSTNVLEMYDVIFAPEPSSVVYPDEPYWPCGNSQFVIKFLPKISKIAFWSMGQESHYMLGQGGSYRFFDQEMADSFRFIY